MNIPWDAEAVEHVLGVVIAVDCNSIALKAHSQRDAEWEACSFEWLDRISYYSSMKIVGITEAKNRLSALIDGLKAGSRVLIVDRGRPVARLEPVTGGQDEEDGRIARLLREGVLRPGHGRMPQSLLTEQPPRMKSGASAVAILIEERRDGR